MARRQAQEYFRIRKSSKPSGCQASQQQQPATENAAPSEEQDELLEMTKVVETYKILIFQEVAFRDYLSSLDGDYLRKEFRRLAMLIHPDKNSHPNAKLAFQKLYNTFVEVSRKSN